MRKLNVMLSAFLISGLLASQVMADTGAQEPGSGGAAATSPVITVGQASTERSQLPTATSVPTTVYQPGSYQAGRDIPAGEYVVLAQPGAYSPIYYIYSGSGEDAQAVDYDLFDYNAIIRLEEGQVLELEDCTASPIEEVPEIDHFYGRMYKVGYHIPAGTYELKNAADYGVCYVLSYPTDSSDAVLDYTYVEDTAVTTVADGQYLQLIDCVLSGTATAETIAAAQAAREQEEAEAEAATNSAAYLYNAILNPGSTDNGGKTSVITAGTSVAGLPVSTSVPSTRYPEGTYAVGADIPAGEYVLLAPEGTDIQNDLETLLTAAETRYYVISTDPAMKDDGAVVDYGNVIYDSIIRLEEGQYLQIADCTASPIDQVPQISYRKGTAFKVGYHIPAGTYHFQGSQIGMVYILSAPTMQTRDIINYELVYGDVVTVDLAEGQYLINWGCTFVDSAPPAVGPGEASAQEAAMEEYFAALFGLEDEAPAQSPVITVTPRSSDLPTATSVPSTVYPAGQYLAGTDIPAGEYMLLADYQDGSRQASLYGASYTAGYAVTTVPEPESYDQILDYNDFTYNAIIRVEDGQYLTTEGCSISPVEEVPQLDCRKGEMFRVGLHIPAGTYSLTPTAGSRYGYCYVLSYPSDNYSTVVGGSMVEAGGATTVTVQDGQYLQLEDCVITRSVASGGGPGVVGNAADATAADDKAASDGAADSNAGAEEAAGIGSPY